MVVKAQQSQSEPSMVAENGFVRLKSTRWIKRPVDFLVSSLIVVLLLPFLIIIAILIKLDTRGSVFYSCSRLGKDGRTFRFYKFRSMYNGAPKRLKEMMQRDPRISGEYLAYHKLQRDPRVTRVGRILRRFSLDELPQLWNIIKGDMSLIGPRPYLPEERSDLGESEVSILAVRPGLTGLWQVSGRNRLGFDQRIELDAQYVIDWSLKLDIRILARTIPVVIKGDGAY